MSLGKVLIILAHAFVGWSAPRYSSAWFRWSTSVAFTTPLRF